MQSAVENSLSARAKIPISLLTGFLGSGKTTLLNKLLASPEMSDTAVLINEFGDVGLDHLLVEKVEDSVVLLSSGCICCTVRSNLVESLHDLFVKRSTGQIRAFARVLIETTGLADPGPILHSLIMDPMLTDFYRLDSVITTVDAVNAARQMDESEESVKQAAIADCIVITKTDIADEKAVEALTRRLDVLNPAAPKLRARYGELAPEAVFSVGLLNLDTKIAGLQRWLNAEVYDRGEHGHYHAHEEGGHRDDRGHAHHDGVPEIDVNRHDDRIRAFCLIVDEPINWNAFVEWLDGLLVSNADKILRIKGILDVQGKDQPIAIHGVHQVFHPPIPVRSWGNLDRRSRIVFITRDLDRWAVEQTFLDHDVTGIA